MTATNGGAMRKVVGVLFWLLITALVIAALSVVGGRQLYDRLDEEIRLRAERQLQSRFPGLQITVGAARRLENTGLLLQQVRAQAPGGDRPLAVIGEVLVRCATDLTQLARQRLDVRSIELRDVRVQLRQQPDGSWLADPSLLQIRSSGEPPVPIQVVDAQLSIQGAQRRPLELRNIRLELLPHYADNNNYAQWRLDGQIADGAARAQIDGLFDPQQSQWALTAQLQELRVEPWVLDYLRRWTHVPPQLSGAATLRNLRIDAGGGHQQPTTLCGSADIVDGRLEDSRLPQPVDGIEGHVSFDQRSLHFRQLTARFGGALLEIPELSRHADGSFTVSGVTRGLRLDRRLAEALPAAMRRSWDAYRVVGLVDEATWELTVDSQQAATHQRLDLRCSEVSFHFPSLPYRFHRTSGSLKLRDGQLSFSMAAPVGGQQVSMVGEIRDIRRDDSPGWMEIGTSGGSLPLNEEMIAALDPAVQQVVRSFNPRGNLELWGRLQRQDGKLTRNVVVRLEELSVAHRSLPYPVDHISGTLTMEDGAWLFDVRGINDGAQIRCVGDWQPEPAGQPHLKLSFHCQNVALDGELRQALPADLQRLWAQMQPRGILDSLLLNLSFDAVTRKTTVRLRLEEQPAAASGQQGAQLLALRLGCLPYQLEEVSGVVTYQDQRCQLQEIRGRHGHTRLLASGNCQTSRDRWRMSWQRLIVDNLQIDRDLLAALPASAARNLAALQLRGPLDIDGTLTLGGPRTADQCTLLRQAEWDLALDMENVSLRFGELPLNHIRGEAQIQGQFDGVAAASLGELQIDSLQVREVPVTRLQGPVWLDSRSLRLGSWAQPVSANQKPRQLRAEVVGGVATADAFVRLDEARPFELNAALFDARLEEIAQHATHLGGAARGKARGALKLRGSQQGVHTLQGDGYVKISDADIYEVPAVLSILRTLSPRAETDRSLFSHGDVGFRVVGDRLYLDRLNLDGGAIRLKGQGEMNLQRQIDLRLFAALGSEAWSRQGSPLDLFRPLFREASRNILEIEVGGTLEAPQITRRAFPELNDTLKRLFPEVQRRSGPTVSSLPGIVNRLRRR